MPEPRHGATQFLMQLGEIIATDVAELDLLEIAPNPFIGVQLRRIGWELLQMDPRRTTGGQKVPDRLGPVDGRPIPEHQELPGDVPQQVAQEAHHIGAVERLPAHLQQQLSRGCEPTDHGEVIPGQKRPQDGRLPPWGPRPDDGREQIERGFIHPDQRARLTLRLFFSPPATARRTRR